MEVLRSLREVLPAEFAGGSSVAIGKFDGVHRGHQAIIAAMLEHARSDGSRSVVFTFTENPLRYLRPQACPPALMSRAQREEACAEAGVDVCLMIDFDAEFASIPAESFVRDILVGSLGAKHVVMGEGFRFGSGGAGDGALLTRLGADLGFSVDIVRLVGDADQGVVSSSRIRDAISNGEVAVAARMLGRLPAVRGTVVRGDARGREIGYPTANLGGRIEGLVPGDGVYAGWVTLPEHEAGSARYAAAISVGNNPTFTPDAEPRVEAYLLDFSDDIYGQPITVEFVDRVRGMETFGSLPELLEHMDRDILRVRRILDSAK